MCRVREIAAREPSSIFMLLSIGVLFVLVEVGSPTGVPGVQEAVEKIHAYEEILYVMPDPVYLMGELAPSLHQNTQNCHIRAPPPRAFWGRPSWALQW